MLFIAYCADKAGHLHVRQETRPAHLAFLAEKGDDLKLAGPTLDESGDAPNGSLLIFEASDIDAAKSWVARDPYAAAGLFESVVVKPWRHAIGKGL